MATQQLPTDAERSNGEQEPGANPEAQEHVCAPGYQGPERRNNYDGVGGGGGNRNGRPSRSEVVSIGALLLAAGSLLAFFTFGQQQMDRAATAAVAPLLTSIQAINKEHDRLESEVVILRAAVADVRQNYVPRAERLLMVEDIKEDFANLGDQIKRLDGMGLASMEMRAELNEENNEIRRRTLALERELADLKRALGFGEQRR